MLPDIRVIPGVTVHVFSDENGNGIAIETPSGAGWEATATTVARYLLVAPLKRNPLSAPSTVWESLRSARAKAGRDVETVWVTFTRADQDHKGDT